MRIERLEEAVEGVVAGNALGQFQKGLEPVFFGAAKILQVIEALAAAEQRADRDDQEIDEPVLQVRAARGSGRSRKWLIKLSFGCVYIPPHLSSVSKSTSLNLDREN